MKWAPQGSTASRSGRHAWRPSPSVAIGGSNPQRLTSVFEAGADSAAVVTDITSMPIRRKNPGLDRRDRAMALSPVPHVLIIAGSNFSGGAGIVRDIETVAAFGLRARLAVNRGNGSTYRSVEHIEHVAPALVVAQMRAALEANAIAAIKIGMLGTKAVAEAVASVLLQHPSIRWC